MPNGEEQTDGEADNERILKVAKSDGFEG